MGRLVRTSARPPLLPALIGLLCAAGCAPAPSAVSTGSGARADRADPAVRALHGIATLATPRLSDLGDVGLLDDDSAMRDALVGGDAEVVVAATMYGSSDMFALDLVVLNRRDQVLELSRADLQVADANGRWLEPVTTWTEGDRHGFSGRRGDRARYAVTYEIDQDRDLSSSRLMHNFDADWGSTSSVEKRPVPARSKPLPRHADPVTRSPGEAVEVPTGSPLRASIPPADGTVFWGYFRGDEPVFPLTAMVLVNGEQILFHFDR